MCLITEFYANNKLKKKDPILKTCLQLAMLPWQWHIAQQNLKNTLYIVLPEAVTTPECFGVNCYCSKGHYHDKNCV